MNFKIEKTARGGPGNMECSARLFSCKRIKDIFFIIGFTGSPTGGPIKTSYKFIRLESSFGGVSKDVYFFANHNFLKVKIRTNCRIRISHKGHPRPFGNNPLRKCKR